jgi:peptidoglycan/LPS O-acetylase OafA/YrhL
MKESSSRLAYGIAIVAGTTLWLTTSAIGGKREPWDSSIYWTVTYPAAIALAGLLGYVFPERPWRWAVIVIFMQAAVMVIAGSGFGLLPLGLILLTVLSLPAVVLAKLAAKLRLRREDG